MKIFLRAILVASSIASLSAMPLQVMAHGGEDHGAETAVQAKAEAAPRAVAQSEAFELVAILDGRQLIVTLDRFATNEPVPDAQIEIDSGTQKTVATQIAPGTYAISADQFVSPGTYPLTLSIETAEDADLLTATLEVAAPFTEAEPPRAIGGLPTLGTQGCLLLAAGAILTSLAIRRYKSRSRT